MQINFSVKQQILTAECPGRLVIAESRGHVYALFSLDEEWDGLTVTALFSNDYVPTGARAVVLTGKNPVEIPPEILVTGKLRVSLVGVRDEGRYRLTTLYMEKPIIVFRSGAVSGNTSNEIPDLWEQVLALIGDLDDLNTSEKQTLVAAINEAAAEAKAVGDALSDLEKRTGEGLGGALVTTSKQVLTGLQKNEARSNIGAGAEPFFFDVRYDEATDKFYADAFWNGETKTITKSLLSNVNSSTTIVTSIKYKGVSFEGEYCGCTDTHAQFLANIPSENFTALISVTLGNLVGNYTRLPFGSFGGSGGDIALDTTLSIPGMAADAAAVGTAINQLSSKNEEFQTELLEQIGSTVITLPQDWDEEQKEIARKNIKAAAEPTTAIVVPSEGAGKYVAVRLDENGEPSDHMFTGEQLGNMLVDSPGEVRLFMTAEDGVCDLRVCGSNEENVHFIGIDPNGNALLFSLPMAGTEGTLEKIPLGSGGGGKNARFVVFATANDGAKLTASVVNDDGSFGEPLTGEELADMVQDLSVETRFATVSNGIIMAEFCRVVDTTASAQFVARLPGNSYDLLIEMPLGGTEGTAAMLTGADGKVDKHQEAVNSYLVMGTNGVGDVVPMNGVVGLPDEGAAIGKTVRVTKLAPDMPNRPMEWEYVDFPDLDSEGEYELIETITVEEEVTEVLKQFTEKYNALMVTLKSVTSETTTSRVLYTVAGVSNTLRGGGGEVSNGDVLRYIWRKLYGAWDLFGYIGKSSGFSTMIGQTSAQNIVDTKTATRPGFYRGFAYIDYLRVYAGNETIPAGTIITIYGVRA